MSAMLDAPPAAPSDRELIDAAIAAGMVKRIPRGVSGADPLTGRLRSRPFIKAKRKPDVLSKPKVLARQCAAPKRDPKPRPPKRAPGPTPRTTPSCALQPHLALIRDLTRDGPELRLTELRTALADHGVAVSAEVLVHFVKKHGLPLKAEVGLAARRVLALNRMWRLASEQSSNTEVV